jgi:predicted site-specific integrase-resolvase
MFVASYESMMMFAMDEDVDTVVIERRRTIDKFPFEAMRKLVKTQNEYFVCVPKQRIVGFHVATM